MRVLWTIVRVALLLVAVITVGLTPFWVSSSAGGTAIDPAGGFTDLLALAVIVLAGESLWRDRRPR